MHPKCISIFILGTLACAITNSGANLEYKTRIFGTVTDENGSRVSNASVVIQGSSQHWKVRTAEDGTYETTVEPGRLTMELTHIGFCPWRRPSFIANSADSVQFDFRLVKCARTHRMATAGKSVTGESEDYSGPYRNESFGADLPEELEALFWFGQKAKSAGKCTFRASDDRKGLPAVFMFNWITIYAESIQYDLQKHEVVAVGNVTFDDGRYSQSGMKLTMKLGSPSPKPTWLN
jgi:hypothetical protein